MGLRGLTYNEETYFLCENMKDFHVIRGLGNMSNLLTISGKKLFVSKVATESVV